MVFSDRVCSYWYVLEDEIHCMFYCNLYSDLRQPFLERVHQIVNGFNHMNMSDRLSVILSDFRLTFLTDKF